MRACSRFITTRRNYIACAPKAFLQQSQCQNKPIGPIYARATYASLYTSYACIYMLSLNAKTHEPTYPLARNEGRRSKARLLHHHTITHRQFSYSRAPFLARKEFSKLLLKEELVRILFTRRSLQKKTPSDLFDLALSLSSQTPRFLQQPHRTSRLT